MQPREIILTAATIKHGRLYFPTSDTEFFPSDSYGDRTKCGHKGACVTFSGQGLTFETYIRELSGKRFSPQRSFGTFLKNVGAVEGARLRVTRVAERAYQLDYLGC